MSKHKKLWNELPIEERKRLMPYQIESQILHIRQCREVAVNNHKRHLRELDGWIKNLEHELSRRDIKDNPPINDPSLPVIVAVVEEMVAAMKQYQMDVEDDPTRDHREMMSRAEEILKKTSHSEK